MKVLGGLSHSAIPSVSDQEVPVGWEMVPKQ